MKTTQKEFMLAPDMKTQLIAVTKAMTEEAWWQKGRWIVRWHPGSR